jgi:hypothetical protein
MQIYIPARSNSRDSILSWWTGRRIDSRFRYHFWASSVGLRLGVQLVVIPLLDGRVRKVLPSWSSCAKEGLPAATAFQITSHKTCNEFPQLPPYPSTPISDTCSVVRLTPSLSRYARPTPRSTEQITFDVHERTW